jgi:hypothetical protein
VSKKLPTVLLSAGCLALAAALFVALDLGGALRAESVAPAAAAPAESGEPSPLSDALSSTARSPLATASPTAKPSAPAPIPPAVPEATALGALSVRVVDPWKRPISEKFAVRAIPLDGSRPLSDAVDRIADSIELRFPVGAPHRIEVEPARASVFGPGSYEPAYAPGTPITVALPLKGGRISGRVVAEESGDPPQDPSLMAFASGEGPLSTTVVSLEPNGGFDFLTAAGEVELTGVATGRSRRTLRIEVDPGEWIRDVEIALPLGARLTLRGRVVDDSGFPVAGATARATILRCQDSRGEGRIRVFHSAGERSTDREGKFQLEPPPADEHTLEVLAAGHEPSGPILLDLSMPEGEVEVVLARAGSVRVRGRLEDGSPWTPERIVLARGGTSVAEATLRRDRMAAARGNLFASRPHLLRRRFSSRAFGAVKERSVEPESAPEALAPADEEGFAALGGIAPGEYEVELRDGFLEGKAKALVVAGETTTVEAPLRQEAGKAIGRR